MELYWRVVFSLAGILLDKISYKLVAATYIFFQSKIECQSIPIFIERERTSTTTLKMMSNFASMTKHFRLGSSRVLFAQKKSFVYKLKIFEKGLDNRYVNFSIVRWASFIRAIHKVQNAIMRSIPTHS